MKPYRPEPDPTTRPTAPAPTPHARRMPAISLGQLQALKAAYDNPARELPINTIHRLHGRALANRGLVQRLRPGIYLLTDAGRTLIRTQYAALKQVMEAR